MRLRSFLAIALSFTPSACGGDAEAAKAAAALASFQAALQRGDEAGCRALVTSESQAAIAALPWQELGHKRPLVVLGAEGQDAEFLVCVQDPNDGDRRSEFVVVKEYGRFVVDLVATAGRHVEYVEAAGSREEFVPRALTPEDLERIRRHELAQPPR